MSRTQPNILLILVDSAIQHVYRCYGGPVDAPAAADRLAEEGVRLTGHFSAAPICHPARSVIDTGLFPHANGQLTNRCGRGAYPFAVWPHVPSLAQRLAAAGYRCGYAGQGHIAVRGFHVERAYPTDEYHAWLRDCGYEREWARDDAQWRGCGIPPYGVEHARDTRFAVRGVELLEDLAADRSTPWFMQCDFDGPHPPCLLPEEYAGLFHPDDVELPVSLRDPLENHPPAVRRSRDAQGGPAWNDDDWRRYIAFFYGMTRFIDDLAGRLLETLDRLELAHDTLVLYTSDHGGLMGAHGFVMHGSPAQYDEALRVPMLVRWPAALPMGGTVRALTSHADLAPSLADAAVVPIGEGVHGRSFLPLLRGEDVEWRDSVYGQYHGDGVLFYSVRMVRTHEWKYTYAPHGGEELYHLATDPWEMVNRAADPTAVNSRRQMQERLHAWMEQVDDPLRHTGLWRHARRA